MMKRLTLLLFTLLLACSAAAGAAPIAAGKQRFLGCAYSPSQAQDFTKDWNKVTPENAGKWGSVEAVRGRMDWGALDEAYNLAKRNNMPFQMHVLVWGAQQPLWMRNLSPTEQRAAIEHWFAAVAQRYPDIDLLEVANETLPGHNQPDNRKSDSGNYIQALGGTGSTGVDWVLQAFRLARQYFPRTKLMINDFGITSDNTATRQYLHTIQLLQQEHLINAIGVQEHAFETEPYAPIPVHRANLDLLATTGLPIYVTEFDLDGPNDAQQLANYQRVFPLFWEHPSVRGVTMWGFRRGLWRDKEGAYLERDNNSERPAMAWLRSYVASRP
ncbi:1,4-beta-xylanase [Xanthomonas translucens pv. arrhenatheri]|jgi:endo-1,4-beta-xylanase|nr:endo-1,4-beta-xylanase [Xanthomonas translucens]OAX58830.1 1,4-beta-xylanase [Xanthomonas translucens pv. graminis]OAX64848.1 1,4-beta-xylanase [Xanthomonas translucens pv. arrhenatheri]UKE56483.1 endo-1,4-beta-xylanase [Xanthomonas translucens pv. graminis]UKE77646.1 endo-1,4-beta-xylanase [Xanthomonas translucens pv. arrhenatheri]WIH10772.1 endo-1,4-beta-xylanase [Xanthomonas translucens pv. graminis]